MPNKKKLSLVRKLRLHAFISQKELAEMCDVYQSTISLWERILVRPYPKSIARLISIAEKSGFYLTERMLKSEYKNVGKE
jgi:transcriptional regulator with XRE-family HTH domain